MARAKYSQLAATDLYENAEYIAKDKPDAAYRWIEQIERACQNLSENPELGQARNSRVHGACRSFTVGNYVIFFRRRDDGVEVIRIVRGERDLDKV